MEARETGGSTGGRELVLRLCASPRLPCTPRRCAMVRAIPVARDGECSGLIADEGLAAADVSLGLQEAQDHVLGEVNGEQADLDAQYSRRDVEDLFSFGIADGQSARFTPEQSLELDR